MILDPPFTAEFADAGFLAEVPQDAQGAARGAGHLQGRDRRGDVGGQAGRRPVLVQHPGALVPQVLRREGRHRHDAAGHLGPDHRRRRGQRRPGRGAGQQVRGLHACGSTPSSRAPAAQLVENADKGVDARPRRSTASRARRRPRSSRSSPSSEAAPADLVVSNEGTAGSTFGGDNGSFLVNWTYIFHNYDETSPEVADDIGYTRYPQTVEGEESRPPYGGIGIGVSEFSDDKELALEAAACLVEPENQGINAELTGNMPASTAGYDYPELAEHLPRRPPAALPGERRHGRPRARSRRTGATSPARSRTPGTRRPTSTRTPRRSPRTFIEEILAGRETAMSTTVATPSRPTSSAKARGERPLRRREPARPASSSHRPSS